MSNYFKKKYKVYITCFNGMEYFASDDDKYTAQKQCVDRVVNDSDSEMVLCVIKNIFRK